MRTIKRRCRGRRTRKHQQGRRKKFVNQTTFRRCRSGRRRCSHKNHKGGSLEMIGWLEYAYNDFLEQKGNEAQANEAQENENPFEYLQKMVKTNLKQPAHTVTNINLLIKEVNNFEKSKMAEIEDYGVDDVTKKEIKQNLIDFCLYARGAIILLLEEKEKQSRGISPKTVEDIINQNLGEYQDNSSLFLIKENKQVNNKDSDSDSDDDDDDDE